MPELLPHGAADHLTNVTDWNSNVTSDTYDDAGSMKFVELPKGVAKAIVFSAVCLLGVGSVACHDDPANIGMAIGPEGALEVLGSLCEEDERIVRLRMWDSESGAVLWDIISETGSRDRSFTAGALPQGFVEAVPFTTMPEPAASIGAEMEIRSNTRAFRISRVYRVADLVVGSIRAHGELVDPEDWDDYVADRVCTTEEGLFR